MILRFIFYFLFVFQEITDIVFKVELYFQAALLGIIVTAMPPYFAMENAENHKVIGHVKNYRCQVLSSLRTRVQSLEPTHGKREVIPLNCPPTSTHAMYTGTQRSKCKEIVFQSS